MKTDSLAWLEPMKGGRGSASRSINGMALQAISGAVVLLSAMILGRILDPEDYGVAATILPVVALGQMLKDFGITTAIVQSSKITQGEVTAYFWLQAMIGLILGGLLAASGRLWAGFFSDERLVILVIPMGAILFLGILGNVHNALLRRNLSFGRIALNGVISAVAGMIAGIIGGLAGLGYWALVIQQGVTTLVMVAGHWTLCSWRPSREKFDRAALGGVAFGGTLTLGRLLDYVRKNVDLILIRKFTDETQLGYYGRGQRLMLMPITYIMGPVMSVAFPMLSRTQESPEYNSYFENVFRFCIAVVVPVGVFGFFFPEALVRVLLGEKWMEAVPIFRGLGIGAVFLPVGNCISLNLVVYRKMRLMLILPAITAALSIIAYILGIPHGVATLAEYYGMVLALMVPIYVIFVVKHTPVSGQSLLKVALPLTGCMTIGVIGAKGVELAAASIANELLRYISVLFAFGIIYAGGVLLLAGYWKQLKLLLSHLRTGSEKDESGL